MDTISTYVGDIDANGHVSRLDYVKNKKKTKKNKKTWLCDTDSTISCIDANVDGLTLGTLLPTLCNPVGANDATCK